MPKAVIIDDEPLARSLIRTFLSDYPDLSIAGEAGDGFEGFKLIQEQKPDLVFLDVQMPRLHGFEMLELLDETPSVIFTTAFDEYAVKAFDSHAVDYLLKPISKTRFAQAMEKWSKAAAAGEHAPEWKKIQDQKLTEQYAQRIVVKDRGNVKIIPASAILYVEADDDYIRVHTAEGKFLKKSTLAAAESQLDPEQFVRVHRSYIVPVAGIAKIEPYEKDSHMALLTGGAKVPVSRPGLSRLKQVLGW